LSESVYLKWKDDASPYTETLRLLKREEVRAAGGRGDERHYALTGEQLGQLSAHNWDHLRRKARRTGVDDIDASPGKGNYRSITG
jgi:hypothetical protein